MSQLEQIKNILINNKIEYVEIPDDNINKIYELLVNKTIFEPITSVELLYTGFYFLIENIPIEMEKYYILACDMGNADAMYNLALYYKNLNNIKQMIEFLLKAIRENHAKANEEFLEYTKKTALDTDPEVIVEYIHIEIPLVQDNMPKLFLSLKRLIDYEIDPKILDSKYTENGLGFEEAKADFDKYLREV